MLINLFTGRADDELMGVYVQLMSGFECNGWSYTKLLVSDYILNNTKINAKKLMHAFDDGQMTNKKKLLMIVNR